MGDTLIVNGIADFGTNSISTDVLEISLFQTSMLQGSGDVTVNDRFVWVQGGLRGTGTLTVAADATLELSGNGPRVIDGWTVNNAGTAEWSGGEFRTGNHAVFNNIGRMELQGTSDHLFGHDYQLGDGSLATFNNIGVIVQSGGAGSFGAPFNNSGSVAIEGGTFWVPFGGSSSGSFYGTAGTTLSFGGRHEFSGSSSITGDHVNLFASVWDLPMTVGGTYSANSTTVGGGGDFNGRTNFTGTVLSVGDTLIVNGIADFGTNSISTDVLEISLFQTSMLQGSGDVTVNDRFVWVQGGLRGTGTLTVAADATLELSGNGPRVIDGWTVNNAGTAEWSGGEFRTGNHAVFNNIGRMELQGTSDHLFGHDYQLGDGSLATFNNIGVIVQSGGAGSFGAPFNNSGSVAIEGGTFWVPFGGSSSGSFYGTAGTALSFGGRHEFSGSSSITGDHVNLFASFWDLPMTVGGTYSANSTTVGGGGDFNGQTEFAGTLQVALGGLSAVTQYDQVRVNSAVALNGMLSVSLVNGFSPHLGDMFTIIDNSLYAVTGTFAGLPEGATFTVPGGAEFQISYAGGDGNDVTLACTREPVVNVSVDILPESFNLDSNGTLTVVIYGAPGFSASQINVSSVLFAGAHAWQDSLMDVNQDGLLDLQLKFRRQDTNLDAVYSQLLLDDFNADGVLDTTQQNALVAITGETYDHTLFSGRDSMSLFRTGRSLRNLLAALFGS